MENVYDKVLDDLNLNYEQLNPAEKETYNKANFATQKLSIGDVINYVDHMKNSVGLQLAQTSVDDEIKVVLLQARLHNYILMEAFLRTPERAEKALLKQIEAKGKNK